MNLHMGTVVVKKKTERHAQIKFWPWRPPADSVQPPPPTANLTVDSAANPTANPTANSTANPTVMLSALLLAAAACAEEEQKDLPA